MKKRSRNALGLIGTAFVLVWVAAPASALPVQFIEVGTSPIGFNPTNFPMPVDIPLALDADVRGAGTGVGPTGFELSVSTCTLINESVGAGCNPIQPTGSTGYTQIVDITLVALPEDATGTESLIFFSALPPVPTYTVTQVSFIVNPTPIGGYDTFTPFTTASYSPNSSMTYYYLGFVLNVGETARFRVDVAGDHSMAGMPLVFAANGVVVPEPGTAMLVGIGLFVLARRRSR